MNGSVPLGQARIWLRHHLADGVRCPCCGQFTKVYRRKIHSSMARSLIAAHHTAGHAAFHGPTLLGRNDGTFAKLAYWGLAAELPGERDDGGKHAGWWEITDDGRAFVLNQLRVPKYIRTFDARVVEIEVDELVTIVDALGTKFRYDELMRDA